MDRYVVEVGRGVARWLADPVRGPLGASGFYGQDASGRVTDLGNGWVLLDEEAVDTLRAIPSDRDGHISDDDGPQLRIGAARHTVLADLASGPDVPKSAN